MYASELGIRLINTLQNLSKYYSVPSSKFQQKHYFYNSRKNSPISYNPKPKQE